MIYYLYITLLQNPNIMKSLKCLLLFFISMFILCCKKPTNNNTSSNSLPVIVELQNSNIQVTSSVSCTVTASITSDGGTSITAKGFCWSINHNPTVNDNKTNNGTGINSFTSHINGLHPMTTYYLRVYATNANGTAYSNEVSFITNDSIVARVPTVLTLTYAFNLISEFTTVYSRLVDSGSVDDSGYTTLCCKGVVFSTQHNPTVDMMGTPPAGVDSAAGYFYTNLFGLAPNTTYYARAYATNAVGVGYGNEISFTTPPQSITDIDGNLYATVQIGTQTWMKENLRVKKFNDGTPIRNVTDDNAWSVLTTPAWCYLNNDANNDNIYGKLYNWYAVNSSKKICPVGWRVSAKTDWLTLQNYVGSNAGKHLKANSPLWNTNTGDNTTGFTALPGGNRTQTGGWLPVGNAASFWTSTIFNSTIAYSINLGALSDSLSIISLFDDKTGMSVRCIKQ
ncbi:MAG: hypothetical protein JWN78_2486 [Bacteroidota bacterium]|nr:hypothetical protein [Bacteroidota bacterium]